MFEKTKTIIKSEEYKQAIKTYIGYLFWFFITSNFFATANKVKYFFGLKLIFNYSTFLMFFCFMAYLRSSQNKRKTEIIENRILEIENYLLDF